jgi:hypothetical protein
MDFRHHDIVLVPDMMPAMGTVLPYKSYGRLSYYQGSTIRADHLEFIHNMHQLEKPFSLLNAIDIPR